jgi:GNAT superfamily N-acetyltransferase
MDKSKLLQKERIARFENLKSTCPLKKWRFSIFYRTDLSLSLSKIARDSIICNKRSNMHYENTKSSLFWMDIYIGLLLPLKKRQDLQKNVKILVLKPKSFTIKKRDATNYKSGIKKNNRIAKFLQTQKISHDLKVLENRGLYIPGYKNSKQNLGNILHISEKYDSALDMDNDQSRGIAEISTWSCQGKIVSIYSFKSSPRDSFKAKIFSDAINLVSSMFLEKRIEMDLALGISEDNFTVDILVDGDQVLGVCEYIFMRKYLWIECFAISPDHQKQGIGKWYMNYIKSIASRRKKSILLYSLMPVIDFYSSLGFTTSVSFPSRDWHMGKFLTIKHL